MNVHEFLNSSGEEGNSDMETMDMSLNCEDPELMSSEFFDSVLSLENNMEDFGSRFLSNLEDDINLSSSDASSNVDEVLSPRSFYSESDKYSSCVESNDETATILGNLEGFDELISMLEPIPETEPEKPPVTVQKLPTQIVIQNPNNKKCISKPMISTSQIKKTQGKAKPQILKVQQISNNGNPGWLPLNIKSIKILNSPAEVAAFTGNLRKRKIEPKTEDDNGVSSTNQYPPLVLSTEEKRLLAKEGISLPTHHPLTKNDERELKRIRRKIRNKISAQDSRKRKKEYVDNLEEKVRRGSEDNKNLLQRVKALQRQNKTLIAHVTKLQALICNSTTTKATPSTCLMVVLLSALLVSLPNLKLFESKHSQMQNDQEQVAVRRSLLSSPQTAEDNVNMEEFLIFKDEEEFEVRTDELDSDNSTEQEITKILEDMGKKYNDGNPEKDTRGLFGKVMETVKGFLTKDNKKELFGASDYGGYNNKRGFIEPEIDEYSPDEDPPSKRVKTEFMPPLNENIVTTTVNRRKIALNTKEK